LINPLWGGKQNRAHQPNRNGSNMGSILRALKEKEREGTERGKRFPKRYSEVLSLENEAGVNIAKKIYREKKRTKAGNKKAPGGMRKIIRKPKDLATTKPSKKKRIGVKVSINVS